MQELPRFQELIFEDFARFILVENTYEEVVLQTVMKDILQGVCQPPGGPLRAGSSGGWGEAIPTSAVLGGILIARRVMEEAAQRPFSWG